MVSRIFSLMADTEVLTVRGHVAVSDLCFEDHLILHSGAKVPVAWISDKNEITVEDETNWPILVLASAVCGGVPRRNVLVLPHQTIYLNGTLIPANLLVNGRTIRRLKATSIVYRDVELRVSNAESPFYGNLRVPLVPVSLYAEGLPVGPKIDADQDADNDTAIRTVRTALLARADIQCSADPALSLRSTAEGIFIESRSCILGEISNNWSDRRRLVVKVDALLIGGKEIPFDHPALQIGWYEPEENGRWTNGNALIPNEFLKNSRDVKVKISKSLRYPLDEDRERTRTKL
jgi:hypothetical protein